MMISEPGGVQTELVLKGADRSATTIDVLEEQIQASNKSVEKKIQPLYREITTREGLHSGSLAQRCTRCSTWLRVDFAFCTNCGQKSSARSTSSVPLVADGNPARAPSKTLRTRQKKKVKKEGSTAANLTLNLPRDVLLALDSILARPALDDQTLTKRMVQQFQTQVLEMRNAEGVEVATMCKHVSSLALEAPSLMGSSKYEVIEPPSHHYSSSDYRKPTTILSATSRAGDTHAKPSNLYLGNVESISSHYKAYMARLKQLEGLRAAMMEPPQLPSEQQRESTSVSARASRGGVRSRSPLPVAISSVLPGSSSPPSVQANSPFVGADQTSFPAREEMQNTGGVAFMWGPIFNPTGSVADESLYSTISQRQGVVLLDAEAALRVSPGASRRNSLNKGSRQGSRDGSPYRDSFFGEKIKEFRSTATGSGKSQSSTDSRSPSPVREDSPQKTPPRSPNQYNSANKPKEKSSRSAPVVMFWGNMTQNQDEEDEDGLSTPGGSSKYPSRMGSFLSASTQLSTEKQLASEEAELPVWIEALAAETAELREEFHEEDLSIMKEVGDRLSKLDAEAVLLQSQRALLVQYSMDAVVKQYWDRMQLLKTGMGLTSTPYKLLAYGPDKDEWSEGEDNGRDGTENVVPTIMAPDGSQEEARASPEDEEQVRAETSQETELDPNDDCVDSTPVASVSSHSTSFYPSKTDRGNVLHNWEKQDFREAVIREKLHTEDEIMMQNLILDLVKAHSGQQETSAVQGSESTKTAAPEPKNHHTFETVARPQTATENRIAGLLQSWEEQEERERQQREDLQSTDDFAIKQWLVAVCAVDDERATKQTLRTLQLEDLEDHEGDSDDDEESVASAAKRASAEAESSALVVPENNSLSVIKTHYRQSCSKMLAFLSELNVDFTFDQTDNPNFRSEARTKLQFARRILKTSSNVDHKVAIEYRNFLEHCSLRRTAMAMQLSEAMMHASELDKSYRERYAEATREFASHNDAQQMPGSEATRHITSSKHMQAIKLSAELDMRAQGEVVKRLQADEAKLLMDIRQEQFVLSEVLGLWQARHSRTLHSYSLAFKRLSGLVDSTKVS